LIFSVPSFLFQENPPLFFKAIVFFWARANVSYHFIQDPTPPFPPSATGLFFFFFPCRPRGAGSLLQGASLPSWEWWGGISPAGFSHPFLPGFFFSFTPPAAFPGAIQAHSDKAVGPRFRELSILPSLPVLIDSSPFFLYIDGDSLEPSKVSPRSIARLHDFSPPLPGSDFFFFFFPPP